MILTDAGPLVAIFDPSDGAHTECVELLRAIREPIATTTCVLTEVFYLLSPGSTGARNLMDFVADGGLQVSELDGPDLMRAFELMVQYADAPMDLADASLVAMAEKHRIRKIFTIDRKYFSFYRIRRAHRNTGFEVIGPT